MSDHEQLVRETFRAQESEFGPDDAVGLLAGARRRATARHRLTVAGSTLATLVIVGTGVAVATSVGGGNLVASPPGDTPSAVDSGLLPHDWVWRSSRGLQVGVPGGWELNDWGCNMTQGPTFVNGDSGRGCLTPESAQKQVAIIGAGPNGGYEGMTAREITLDGVAATRTEGVLPDGRHAGQLAIPSRRIYLDVRTRDVPELTAILDSAHLVDVDHLGCPTALPAVGTGVGSSDGIVGTLPGRVWVCHYEGDDRLLQGSAELTQDQVQTLRVELDKAPRGRNPDLGPAVCLGEPNPKPDALLRFDNGVRLWVTFSSCTGRGADSGGGQLWHITQTMVTTFMSPLRTAYGMSGDLTGGDK